MQLPAREGLQRTVALATGLLLSLFVQSVPAADDPQETVIEEAPITSGDRDHWAFQPLGRPDVPAVDDNGWATNPIDHFILASLKSAGLSPMPPADRRTLIRRVTFDLTGLPPTPKEIDQFLSDSADDAYEQLVNRLLASPAYGERWAQHWLDLARFAETDGFEHDKVRPNAWRYRDWVIDALNRDLPYDQFVRLQIAGDEIAPDDPDAWIATGFLLCGPDMPDINSQIERRDTFLNDMTGTVGAIFLGLQVGCAKCHAHKYDPISQHDFYRLRAFFDPLELFKDRPLSSMTEPADAQDAQKSTAKDLPQGRVARDAPGEPPKSFLHIRGDFQRPGPEVVPAFLRVVNADGQTVEPHPNRVNSSGRRTALADWLTRPDHPLATRVIVNRIWQHHFAHGLVRTPSDFGIMGEPPTHAELLDWLASEFPKMGWSLKRLHRLMVTSSTYRQASHPDESSREIWRRSIAEDPENQLLSRMNRRRLSGEAIRDAMLAASGELNRTQGGPGVRPPLPEELLTTLLKNQWPVTPDADEHRRRSIYLFVRRNLRYPIFEVFDRPDTNQSCPRRDESTIAPQALTLLNSKFSLTEAKYLASRVAKKAGSSPSEQVTACYRRVLGRLPNDVELAASMQFLEADAEKLRQESRNAATRSDGRQPPDNSDRFKTDALTDFCLVMFNLNEFVYVD